MRFLLINYEFPPVGGGAGKAAFQLAQALVRRAHEVTILTSRFKDLPAEETLAGVRVLRIPVLRRHLNYAASWEVLSFAVSGLARLGWLHREVNPDVVLSFFTIPGSPVALGYQALYGTPFVTFLRGQDVPGYPDTPRALSTLAAPAIRFLWRRSLLVTANSQGLAELARQTEPELDFPIITNAVDPERYRPAATPPPETPVRVLFVGRLREFKGIHHLIEAFARVRQEGPPPCELRIGGFGPMREALEGRVAELGLSNQVQFLGRLDEEQVIEEMQSAHIFANPSYGEGMPNAVLEAMACALAVLVSDIGPHREMIAPETEGLFCAPRDVEMLAGALGRLVGDAALRRRLGEQARQRVLAEFSWDQKAAELLELLQRQNHPLIR